MIDFDKSNVKAVFMDFGGVLFSIGWEHESRQKASEIFVFNYQEMDSLRTLNIMFFKSKAFV